MASSPTSARLVAMVTGASSGIGLALAHELARRDYDLVVVADSARIADAAAAVRADGTRVTPVRADLATKRGVREAYAAYRAARGSRPAGPEVLAVNAGIGLGGRFVDGDLDEQMRIVRVNVSGAVRLTHLVLPGMLDRGEGGILFTSSIAATMPAPYNAVYGASKAFLQSFAEALRVEVHDDGVTVTALMPGPTDTGFFARAGMEETRVGRGKKDDPAEVARDGIDALMAGKDHVVAGSVRNRLQAGAAKVIPQTAGARMHGAMNRGATAPTEEG